MTTIKYKRIIISAFLAMLLSVSNCVPVVANEAAVTESASYVDATFETQPATSFVVGDNGTAASLDQELSLLAEPEAPGLAESDSYSDDILFSTGESAAETLQSMDIKALDGKISHLKDFSEDYKVVLFGRSGCGNTRGMANKAASIRDKGVSLKLVIMDVDEEDSGLAEFASDTRALASLNSPYNNRTMWSLLRLENMASGNVTLPGCFVLDKSSNLVFKSTGSDTAGLAAALSSSGQTPKQTGVNSYPFTMTYGQSEVRKMLQSINDFRTGSEAWAWDSSNTNKVYYKDLQPLTYDYGLEADAMVRAAEIAISYSHTRPNGKGCFSAYSGKYSSAGENIAAGYASGNSVFVAWREDDCNYSGQGHRRNMLSDSVKYVGIGHATFLGTQYWVQEFSNNATSLKETTANDSKTVVPVEIAEVNIGSKSLKASKSKIKLKSTETADLPEIRLSFTVDGHWPDSSAALKTEPVDAVWKSDDTSIAKVNGNKVTGVSGGSTTLTGSYGGMSATVSVSVDGAGETVPVTEVLLSPESLDMVVGSETTLKVTINPQNATNKNVTWSSTKSAVATVDEGVVKAVSKGKAEIKATSEDGNKVASCTINVIDKTTVKSGVFAVGQKINVADRFSGVTGTIVAYKSTSSKIAGVNSKGKVSMSKPGTTTINAYIKQNGKKVIVGSMDITVEKPTFEKPPVINSTESTLDASKYLSNTTLTPSGWKSSKESVVSVDGSGVMTFHSSGKATITALYGDEGTPGKVKTTVTVKLPKLKPKKVSLKVGGTKTVQVLNLGDQKVKWKSQDTKIATVSSDGTITAVAPGTTNVTAVVGKNYELICPVKVK